MCGIFSGVGKERGRPSAEQAPIVPDNNKSCRQARAVGREGRCFCVESPRLDRVLISWGQAARFINTVVNKRSRQDIERERERCVCMRAVNRRGRIIRGRESDSGVREREQHSVLFYLVRA